MKQHPAWQEWRDFWSAQYTAWKPEEKKRFAETSRENLVELSDLKYSKIVRIRSKEDVEREMAERKEQKEGNGKGKVEATGC